MFCHSYDKSLIIEVGIEKFGTGAVKELTVLFFEGNVEDLGTLDQKSG